MRPGFDAMKQPFVFQKTSNHGSANPIVARLAIQTCDLIQWLNVSDEEKKSIIDIYLDLQRRLLSCFDIQQRLLAARDEALSEAVRVWEGGHNTVPYVIGLQDEVENFLFSAKTYLREVARLLNTMFRANLPNEAVIFWNPQGGQSKVVEWAKGRFGEDHGTTRMLFSEAEWIGEIVRKRNAIEHPNEKSGVLKVANYERITAGIVPPHWSREGANSIGPSDLYNDISATMDNLLTLGEDLLIEAIRNDPTFPQIILAFVPEKDRDPKAPVRIRATVDLRPNR
jgi:hypothetical protein